LYASIVDQGEESPLSGAYFDRPYLHLTFQKFFAGDIYRRLISHWPDIDKYVDLNGARTRKQFTLNDRTADAGDPERTQLRRTARDTLSAPASMRRCLNAYDAKPPEEGAVTDEYTGS
jgi:hypothetical protein